VCIEGLGCGFGWIFELEFSAGDLSCVGKAFTWTLILIWHLSVEQAFMWLSVHGKRLCPSSSFALHLSVFNFILAFIDT
jgi:hypothetical protein